MAKLTRKLWVGIGAATIAGASVTGAPPPRTPAHKQRRRPQPPAPTRPPPRRPAEGGEAYLTDGGPRDTRIRFYRDIELMRGHLLVGGQLIALGPVGRGAAAFPAPHRRALRPDGEVHQAAQHPPLQAASCRRWPRP